MKNRFKPARKFLASTLSTSLPTDALLANKGPTLSDPSDLSDSSDSVRPSPTQSNRIQPNPTTPPPLGKEMVKKTVKFLALFDHLLCAPSSPLSALTPVKPSRFNVLTLQRFNILPYQEHVAFSDDTRERVRNANDIVDVIGSYLPLKRAGANFVALCPFHKEKSPSFNVNPHRQIFHCFGCHKGGDVFTFVMEYDSVDFPEALRRLADRAKIPLEHEKGGGGEQTRHLKERLLQMHDQIAQR